jgi:hypothetical protein
MTITMNDSPVSSIVEMEDFLQGSNPVQFQAQGRAEVYRWMSETINKVGYFKLARQDRGVAIRYLAKMSGYSETQTKRLIGKKRDRGCLELSPDWGRKNTFQRVYTDADVEALAETDNLHRRPTGQALQKIFQRMFSVWKDERFARLQHVSLGHIYNLRGTERYRGRALLYTKTDPAAVPIGERRKPQPYGQPGFLRVDSVHQGDLDKEKGVYHVTLVDEVTQWQVQVCVEGISHSFLLPALRTALAQFPFRIVNFHSDNGSEYINQRVAKLLNELAVGQTKSRSRHCNDNALAETKNKITRKWVGYGHIPRRYAPAINLWYETWFNAYLAFHRQCAYPTVYTDPRGKQRKRYETYLTPYEKLKTVESWVQYLALGTTEQQLESTSLAHSDNEFARLMGESKRQIWKTFRQH